MKQSKYPFIPGLLPALLVLAGIGSIIPVPPVAAQDSTADQSAPRRTIPAQYVDLAEEYATQKAEAMVTAERKNNRNQRKRWTNMLREAGNSLDSASDRVDRIQTLLDIASQDDPEIPKLKAEAGARIDRAYEQAKQWADVEEVAVALPEGFANLVTGQLGIQLDFGNGGSSAELIPPGKSPTPDASAELLPPRRDADPGWLAAALNSDEAKGAGGTGALVLLLLAIQRMRRKDQEEGDKRNDQTTEKAAERAIDRVLQKREAQYAGSGSGGTGNQGR